METTVTNTPYFKDTLTVVGKGLFIWRFLGAHNFLVPCLRYGWRCWMKSLQSVRDLWEKMEDRLSQNNNLFLDFTSFSKRKLKI